MIAEVVAEALPAVLVAGSIGSFAALVRWASRVDQSLGNTVKSTALLAEKLNGHEKLDEERHASLQREVDLLRDV
jgi:predicted alpha/beta hydrolase family esterase